MPTKRATRGKVGVQPKPRRRRASAAGGSGHDDSNQVALLRKERDALRLCLLGFLNTGCTCEATGTYRALATQLLNAGRRAAVEARAAGGSEEEVAAAASVSAAAQLAPASATPASSGALAADPLHDILAEVGVDDSESVHSDSTRAPVSPVPAGSGLDDAPVSPLLLQDPPKARVEEYDDAFLDAFLDTVALDDGFASEFGDPLAPLNAGVDSGAAVGVPAAVPFEFGALADHGHPAAGSLSKPAPLKRPISGMGPMGTMAGAVGDNPRPHKMQRTLVFTAIFFLFALAFVPVWHLTPPSSSSTTTAASTVQVGGFFDRGFARDGGYYVSQAFQPRAAASLAAPGQVPPASTGRMLSTLAAIRKDPSLTGPSSLALVSPPRDADADLVVEDVASPAASRAKPVLRGHRDDAPLHGVASKATPPSSMLRIFTTDDRSEEGAANLTLVPAEAPQVQVQDLSGAYVELTKPLQQYANTAFAAFVAQQGRVPRSSSSSSSSSSFTATGDANASFVMCPEALGSLTRAATASVHNVSSAAGQDVALASDNSSSSSSSSSSHAGSDAAGDASLPYLLLMVPSTAIQTDDSSTATSSGWLEIGCTVHSVRHVQSVHLSAQTCFPPRVASC